MRKRVYFRKRRTSKLIAGEETELETMAEKGSRPAGVKSGVENNVLRNRVL